MGVGLSRDWGGVRGQQTCSTAGQPRGHWQATRALAASGQESSAGAACENQKARRISGPFPPVVEGLGPLLTLLGAAIESLSMNRAVKSGRSQRPRCVWTDLRSAARRAQIEEQQALRRLPRHRRRSVGVSSVPWMQTNSWCACGPARRDTARRRPACRSSWRTLRRPIIWPVRTKKRTNVRPLSSCHAPQAALKSPLSAAIESPSIRRWR